MNMNKAQFFTALRFIVLVQNGELPITAEKLPATRGARYGPPRFVDVQIQLPPQGPVGPPAAITEVSRKAIAVQKAALDDGERTADAIKGLVKKLREDKITLAAMLGQAEGDLAQVQQKQRTVLSVLYS